MRRPEEMPWLCPCGKKNPCFAVMCQWCCMQKPSRTKMKLARRRVAREMSLASKKEATARVIASEEKALKAAQEVAEMKELLKQSQRKEEAARNKAKKAKALAKEERGKRRLVEKQQQMSTASVAASKGEIEEDEDDMCKICMVNKVTHAYLHHDGTAHLCVCSGCSGDALDATGERCPICRESVQDIIEVYR